MPYLDSASYELPYQSGSDTSHDAAVKAAKFVGKQGQDVLAYVRSRGAYGATQKEISAALGIARASVCARTRALEKCGQVFKSVIERRAGCAVYFATPEG